MIPNLLAPSAQYGRTRDTARGTNHFPEKLPNRVRIGAKFEGINIGGIYQVNKRRMINYREIIFLAIRDLPIKGKFEHDQEYLHSDSDYIGGEGIYRLFHVI